MMIVLQLVLYCLLFFLLVKAAAGNDGLRCLYFIRRNIRRRPSGGDWRRKKPSRGRANAS